MTPRQFDLLAQRHDAKIAREFTPVANLSAIYVNSHLKEGASPVSPEDFIPGAKRAPKEEAYWRFRRAAK